MFNVNKIDLIKVKLINQIQFLLNLILYIFTKKDKVNDPLDALMYCLEIAEKCMFHPGKVENWVVLVNLGNIGYVPKIPIKVLIIFLFKKNYQDLDKLIKDTTYYYPGCMDRVYLINPPLLVYLSWKIISCFIINF